MKVFFYQTTKGILKCSDFLRDRDWSVNAVLYKSVFEISLINVKLKSAALWI